MFTTPSPTHMYTTGPFYSTMSYPLVTITEPVPTVTEAWWVQGETTRELELDSFEFVDWKSKHSFLNLDTTGEGEHL